MAYWGGFPEYVPVWKRTEKAQKQLAKLRKKGFAAHPVEIEGRTIAQSFWGKAWCSHMERYNDFENRLGRGRSYVKNGLLIHLEVTPGKIHALVSGTHVYEVDITVKPLPPKQWRQLKENCVGQIDSLMDMLKGRMSDGVMREVTNPERGLFPVASELSLSCNCPDWAEMCKHVAAAIYGVGARLDENPELLFLLRGVDHKELVGEAGVAAAVEKGRGIKGRVKQMELSTMFGIDLIDVDADLQPEPENAVQKKNKKASTSKTSVQREKTKKKMEADNAPSVSEDKNKKAALNEKSNKQRSKQATAKRKKPAPKSNKRLETVLRLVKEYVTEKL